MSEGDGETSAGKKGDGTDPDESAADRALLVRDACRQIRQRSEQQKDAERTLAAESVFGGDVPLADEPGGNQEGEGGGLRPLAKEEVAGGGTDGPEENAGGPVLVEIENLRGEENRGAKSGGADGMEGDGERGKAGGEEGSTDVEDGHHEENESKTGGRRKIGPMRGDKEGDTGGEENGAEKKGDKNGPTKRRAALVGGFEGENAVGSGGVNDAGGEPSPDARGELG